jgi:hypothetical protein
MLDYSKWIENGNVSVLVSCLIGFGIAALLRPMCKGPDCVILRVPPVTAIRGSVYQIGEKCHQFNPKAVECPTDPNEKTIETFSFAAT